MAEVVDLMRTWAEAASMARWWSNFAVNSNVSQGEIWNMAEIVEDGYANGNGDGRLWLRL